MIFMQKNACAILRRQPELVRDPFSAVADYSWVILYYLYYSGIWRLPSRSESCCAGCFHGPLYLLLVHADCSCSRVWVISVRWFGVYISRVSCEAGWYLCRTVLLSLFFCLETWSRSQQWFAEGCDSACLAASPQKHNPVCSTLLRRQGLYCFCWCMGNASHDYRFCSCYSRFYMSHWHINMLDCFLLSLLFYEPLKYMQKIVIWLV